MGQVMIVTGASRGIGAATAKLAAARGYSVVVNYVRDAAAAERVVADIERGGQGRAIAFGCDVTKQADVERMFDTVGGQLGCPTALVNNAGVVDRNARVAEIDAARLLRMFSINVFGSFLCAASAVRCMSTAHGGMGGCIVNVSSAAARHGSPGTYVDYAASKAAIDTFTIGLANEVAAEGIRVNAVRPGIIRTEIHASGGDPARAERMAPSLPMQRAGEAEEVARAIVWLCSSEASYCTGSILDVAGGR